MKAIGIILAGGNNEMRLGDLTGLRAASAMPVGSCYRAIDFPLSNMSNSAVNKVAVITQYNSRSLHDHLSSSKWWDFGRKHGGLYVFTPYISSENSFWFRGTADSIYQNISFLERSNESYVVIASGDSIYKMDYRKVIEYHKNKGADITVVCKEMYDRDLTKFGIMQLNSDGRIMEFEEKPIEPQTNIASLGIYIISRTLLIDLLNEIVPEGRFDIVKDIIIRFRRKLNICAYKFDGYWSSVGSGIMEYYNTNMDFLKCDIRRKFTKDFPYTFTKPKDEPPVKYNENADVSNAAIGGGSIINGKVEGSVLFRRVYVGENTVVKNSILMEGCYIGNNCVVENAILDKQVVVSDGRQVIGKENEPAVFKKRSTV
ncbi:glucose-1-phosphate adenylyltransferase subunit GlgD [Lachnospiraceae bacterium NSJ-143]|nr:glucose-1-phosphate adenylyltransferase subunit GlgD [Lachnospiraceae bacterium NSJ-143]